VDLGRNWSNTLQVREGHALVEGGVYRRLRHPMYLALLLYGAGQALAMPNFVAGPAFLVAFAILVAVRLPAEERMMAAAFGDAYAAYAARTKRLLPGLW
jgi:protein-S-isoprenylcysteine O-methyltransferase Ste14